ncbi:porin [Synechococcus sp. WH 8020]|uniref:iron uptake porin n=1 Tax=Synechococcus sp. (strain WH8020) TaxID=32052 RepID=UPI0006527F74|nr:iron uptake porin [Synechococcus sp. WH 8020]AKN62156.1 porin [Synechococcus sp. WH 8020]
MKLFHQLLVAPAALGLLAPVTANATELNINGVSDYADTSALSSREQVTSITQFSDVYPTDWAYQALSNLIERYGCVAGYPNGTYRGNRAMTRFEAAALLNACLDRVTEVTDELQRLMKEFEKELAILKGRVDGLEARVGELEATQFSTTTKLSGLATFVVGANNFSGTKSKADPANRDFGATTFNYDLQLSLETSFTGKDLLLTVLRSGNFGDNSVFGGNPNGLSTLETAFQEDPGANSVVIDKLFYQFPVGNSLTFTLGARVGQEDMLAVWPSAYPSDPILDVTTLNGAPAAYNKNLGAGAGVSWATDNGFSVSANYVAAQGSNSDPNAGGIGTEFSEASGTVQLAFESENWNIAAIWSGVQSPSELLGGFGTTFAADNYFSGRKAFMNAWGIGGSWQPQDSGWIPSISAGYGYNSLYAKNDGDVRASQSWNVGLEWSDVFLKGNNAGMAVGQPVFATDLKGDEVPADGNYVWEWWYQFQVTDNISVTPALFYLSRPEGQNTDLNGGDDTLSQLGGLVKTTFNF